MFHWVNLYGSRERVATRVHSRVHVRPEVEVYNDTTKQHYASKHKNHFDIAYPEKRDRLKEVKFFLCMRG